MRFLILTSMLLYVSASIAMADPCSKNVAPLLNTLFSNLGHDCDAYAKLFASDAKYYHQHDGYKTAAQLPDNCKSYATFCPGNACQFLQNGDALKVAEGDSCQILVPYLWAEIPAKNDNLEPHTGFEYIIARPNKKSRVHYSIESFAEIESTYSVAFDWAAPDQTPAVVAESTLALLKTTASQGECDSPIAPILTKYFTEKSTKGSLYRQQGDAVVLAAGGLCHVSVPYSAQVGDQLRTGQFVFTLQPAPNHSYLFSDSEVVDFTRGAQ